MRVGVRDAEVETRLPLSYEVDSVAPRWCVGDDASLDGGGAQLTLLWTTPPIRMGQYKFDAVRHRVPAELSVLV